MLYGPTAVERAMKRQEIILRAMSGELSWLKAADILRMAPRSLRRWRQRYARAGYDGLLDRRTGRPSPRRAPVEQVERVLQLYREHYAGFNVRHFHGIVRREHGVTLSYTYVKTALQGAGLVRKSRARGRQRRRREPRPCRGELLHLDGSPHEWLALRPGERQTMIQLFGAESTAAVMTALTAVVREHGLPMALYTDRASWAAVTRRAHEPIDRTRRTQVQRALARLGIEHIVAYSPQARGRGERMFQTLQGRVVNELRVAGITEIAAANAYLHAHYRPQHNAEFRRAPADAATAFVAVHAIGLEEILCHEEERTVQADNTVVLDGVRLQLDKQPGRATCARLPVLVRRHLDHTHSVWRGLQCLGRYDADGTPLRATPPRRGARAPHGARAAPVPLRKVR